MERQEGKELVKLDISNAYNALPRNAIEDSLEYNSLASKDQNLIKSMLNASHSELISKVETGTLQGNPLSTLLFVMSINPIIQ